MHHIYQPIKSQAVCHCLSFSSSDNEDNSTSLPLNSMGLAKPPTKFIYNICDDSEEKEEEEEEEETVALNDKHWITDPVLDRHLCIHEHSQPHSLCCYQCLYSLDSAPASYHDTLNLSVIADFKDVMVTSSDEDIPALDYVIGL